MNSPVPRLLLVDDDPRNLRILEGILAPLRYDLRKASNGQEALDQAATEPPDLILLDVMMPGLSGFEVCRHLKAQPATQFIPIVLVTSLTERESKITGLEAGADDFLNKPVDASELRARVKSLLRIKQLHDELEEKNRALEQANVQIQEANQHKSQFLSHMSHDLRTPMNAILGYTRILLRKLQDQIDERQYKNLENIQLSADHLLSLINDILDLSRVEAGRIELKPDPVDLKQLIAQCAASVESLLKPGVALHQQVAEIAPLRTDPDRLRRVLMNLLSNAVKFTSQGSITVAVQPTDGWVELSVVDTGIGIPAEDLPHIFEEFRQVESQGKKREGTGLGLAIAKKSVELLGGSIAVESAIGRGTTFILRLKDCKGQ